ncbi:hypothetical protein [Streptomyces smaragdinus]|nr:hypothetical protein [Streptomyces smaragdinus]
MAEEETHRGVQDAVDREARGQVRTADQGGFVRAVAVVSGGAVTAFAGVLLVGRSWTVCDIGTADLPNLMALMLYAVPLWALATTAWWAGAVVLGRRSISAGLAAALLASACLIWAFMAWQHDPGGDYPAFACPPDNVPPWWPGWLPL